MSFGFGVGDIVTLSTLAWKVFKCCKDASEDFKNLSGEVISLHVVLKETEDLVAENGMNNDQNSQLKHLADGCRKVLEDLEKLINKYKSLGSKSQRTWDRLKWGKEGITDVRARLTSNTTMLSAYNSVMVNSAMTRMERKLSEFMEEIRSGKRESSVTTNSPELLDEQVEDEAGWAQLRRELEDAGVSSAALSEHKAFVIAWFRQKLAPAADEDNPTISTSTDSDFDGSTQITDTASDALYSFDSDTRISSPLGSSSSDIAHELQQQPAAPTAPRVKLPDNSPRNGRSLLDASRIGDIESVEFLLRCKIDINYRKEDRMCALNIAAMYGHTDVVQFLINQSKVALNNRNWLGHTPLSLAAWYGHVDALCVLLNKSDTQIDTKDWEGGQTPLSLAAEQGNAAIVRILLAHGADPNAQDDDGRTALGWAAEKGRREETEILLSHDTILPNLADKRGVTPLHQAVKSRNDHIVRILLSEKSVDLSARDSFGRTAFDIVMHSGNSDLVPYFDIQFTLRGHTG